MTIPLDSANVYTDSRGLDELKLSAENRDPKALEAAAKQFEALFLQQMLKSMRDASLAEGAFDSDESRFYLDMFDKQISLSMSQGEGIGLAKMIINQLKDNVEAVKEIEKVSTHKTADLNITKDINTVPSDVISATREKENVQRNGIYNINKEIERISTLSKQTGTFDPVDNGSGPVTESMEVAKVNIESPFANKVEKIADNHEFPTTESFVSVLWPYAQRAAKKLGVDPKVLVAQAALETGWGKYINKASDGQSSNNIFNIKADERWAGKSITVSTLEFRDGVPVQEKAKFRAYQSIEESFDDYIHFINSSERYHQALKQASSPEKYTQELQDAGYATDPDYSNKIMRIINGEPLLKAFEGLKLSMGQTITSKDGGKL